MGVTDNSEEKYPFPLTSEVSTEGLLNEFVNEMAQLQPDQIGNSSDMFDSLLLQEMLAEFGQEFSTLESGTGRGDEAPSDCDITLTQTHSNASNFVRENCDEISGNRNDRGFRIKLNSTERGTLIVAIKAQLQQQQQILDAIVDLQYNNSELKSQVQQQHKMTVELREQVNRLNVKTFLDYVQQLQDPQVEQEAMAEIISRMELEIYEYDTVVLNERSPSGYSGQVDQRRGIESAQLHTEEFNERRDTITRSEDDVELRDGSVGPSAHQIPLFEDANINQSDGSLRVTQACSVRIKKVGGKRTTFDLRSPEVAPKNPRNSREGSKKHSCGECNKQFKFKSHLTRHIRVHTGEKPFKCEECNAAFIHAGQLKVHQRIHRGEKPFECKDCNAAFSQSSNLKVHQRIHRDEKPFMCDICNKSFRRKSHLSVHMRTHFGGKSHKCNICEKEFRHKSILSKHLKNHPKEKPSKLKRKREVFLLD